MALHSLTCGRLACLFDDGNGHVRRIHADGIEVLRGIYAAVRDRDWNTIAPHLTNLKIVQGTTRSSIHFQARCVVGSAVFAWDGCVEIDGEQGRLSYTFAGEAQSAFTKNRVGFCVLHPAECGGSAVEAEHVDGTRVLGMFPRDIAPHQPFLNLRSLTHHPAPGMTVRVSLRGDTFEMEDQRNWTDASFKTYCTPLALPFPVTLRAGDVVRQEVELLISRLKSRPTPTTLSKASAPKLVVDPDAIARPFPALGFGATESPELESAPSAHRLAALRPAFLRVDLRPSRPDFAARLLSAASEARAAGAGLEVAIHLAPDTALRQLLALADAVAKTRTGAEILRWLVFSTTEKSTPAKTLSAARQALAPLAPAAAFFGGTDAYFAELNRCRPPLAQCDGVTFSINPQVHAEDDLSVLETLPTQAEVVRNALRFSGDKPIIVSPVTLKPRFNPNATGSASVGTDAPPADPRQRTFFCAFWTLGSFMHLSEAGATAITYFRSVGADGLHDPSGQPFPVWHLFRSLADFAGGNVVATKSSDPCCLQGVKLLQGNRRRLLLGYLGTTSLSAECCKASPRGTVGRVIVAGDDEAIGQTIRDEIPPCSLVEWDWIETGSAQ